MRNEVRKEKENDTENVEKDKSGEGKEEDEGENMKIRGRERKRKAEEWKQIKKKEEIRNQNRINNVESRKKNVREDNKTKKHGIRMSHQVSKEFKQMEVERIEERGKKRGRSREDMRENEDIKKTKGMLEMTNTIVAKPNGKDKPTDKILGKVERK